MNKQFMRFLQGTLVLLDIIVLNIVFLICKFFFKEDIPQDYSKYYYQYWILINSFWVIFSWVGGVYAEKSIISFEIFSSRTLKIYIIWFLAIILLLFLTKEVYLSRFFIFSSNFVFGLGLFLNRFAYIGINYYFKRSAQYLKKILIVG